MRRLVVILLSALSIVAVEARTDNTRRVIGLIKSIDRTEDAVEKMTICDSLLSEVGRMPLSAVKGDALKAYATVQQEYGNQVVAHDYFWQAVDVFQRADGDNAKSMSDCYYRMAVDYLNAQDTLNMKSVVDRLGELSALSDNHLVAHDYYSIAATYYSLIIDLAPERTAELRQSLIDASKKAVYHTEQLSGEDYYLINPVWDYFNVALFYDNYFDPPLMDSITLYLDRAERVANDPLRPEPLRDEGLISICDLRAWQAMYRRDYREAERQMNRAVELLDKTEKVRPNTLINERNETYKFFVELALRRGDWRRAFEYQKLLTESDKLRYDIEKAEAIDNVRTRFAIEKSQRRIADLEDANRRTLIMLVAAVFMALLLAGGIVALVLYFRQRRYNMEQRLYEAALTAELSQRELSSIRQSLSASPVSSTIESLKAQIVSSQIAASQRENYLKSLDALSIDSIERALLSATEPVTSMDRKYMVCFMISMTTADIGLLFSIEQASVYVVRYRIKKKFDSAVHIPF